MRIMFDILGTVLGAMDESPRPGIKETIEALRESGASVSFWTSGRPENYCALLKNAGIEGEVFSKGKALPFTPDLCVDDEPQGWMPGSVYRVDAHIAVDMPGQRILVAELLCVNEKGSFYWD